jgi:hypothetical protein
MHSKHRYDPKQLGVGVVHVHETKPHALSHANTITTEEQQETDRREREARAMFDGLPETDRDILRLSQRLDGIRESRLQFPASKRDEQEQAGWLFVQTLKGGYVLMVKSFPTQLMHEEIASRLGISVRRVRYRLSLMSADLVRFSVLKGWV